MTNCSLGHLSDSAQLHEPLYVVGQDRAVLSRQLEMMLRWRDDLEKFKADEVGVVSDAIAAKSAFVPNEKGLADIRRWIRKYGFSEVLAATDEAFEIYLTDDTAEVWNKAFGMIARMLSIRQQEKDDPNIRRLLYIQGIIRARWRMRRLNCLVRLRSYVDDCGVSLDLLEACSKRLSRDGGWDELDLALGLDLEEQDN